MTYPAALDIARGIPGARAVRAYGTNPAIGSTFAPVTRSGFYRTPQVGAVTALRIKSGGNANDTAAGTGARAVTLVGLDASGDVVTETIATAGASASAATTQTFLRLTDAYVSASGTYATQSAQSHAGTITIENAAGGTTWAVIQDTTIPRGAAEIGSYSVPRNRGLYIRNVRLQSDESNKSNVVFFMRTGILQTAAPFDAMTLLSEYPAISGFNVFRFDPPLRVPELSDVGFLANSNTSDITVSVGIDAIELIE